LGTGPDVVILVT